MIQAHGQKIIVSEIKEEERKTQTGLFLAGEETHETPRKGKVLSVGSGVGADGKKRHTDVQIDDVVVFQRYAGTEIDGYIILGFDEVLAKIN